MNDLVMACTIYDQPNGNNAQTYLHFNKQIYQTEAKTL